MRKLVISSLAIVLVLSFVSVVLPPRSTLAQPSVMWVDDDWASANPGTVELSYDDGEADNWWGTGPVGGGGVLFTPPAIPWSLTAIRVMAWYDYDDAPFYIEIWDTEQNELFCGTYMYSDYFNPYPTESWAEIDIPDIVVEDDFYVCVFLNDSPFEHMLVLYFDTDPPVSGRSYAVRYDNNTIDYPEEWNWMIRAIGYSPPPQGWVDDDYTPSGYNDGHTWGYDAFANIQDGIDAVASPGTVHVAAGTYLENIILKDGVQVLGAGSYMTTIEGGSTDSVVTAIGAGANTVIEGFTITNGSAERGGGIHCNNSSPIIKNNRIINNHSIGTGPNDGGGGIYCGSGSNAKIANNIIQNNSAKNLGGGIYFMFSSPTIDGNLIISNAGGLEVPGGQGGGIAGYGDSIAIISNNLIINNSAVTLQTGVLEVGGGGIALDDHANAIIVNNTIDRNSTIYGYGGGIFCDYNASPVVTNNIVTNSLDGEGIWVSSVGANPVIDYNNVWNNEDGNYGGTAQPSPNDISEDPMFVNPASSNYYLQPVSPCIDAGTNTGAPIDDIEGNPRPIDGDGDGIAITDMGAYEYVGCGDVDCDGKVTMNDGRQIFMYLIYGEEQYPLCDRWAADCDGAPGITMNDGRQIFMNLIYGPDDYPLVCE